MLTTIEKLPKSAKELVEMKEKNYLSVYEVLTRLRELENIEREKVVIPEYMSKPKYKIGRTSKELRAYADELEEWEKHDKKIQRALAKRRKSTPNLGAIIEEFIRIESGLTKIPKQYQDGVYSYAYSKGHSCGMHEVYNELTELVDIF